jgi:hypothetical protein
MIGRFGACEAMSFKQKQKCGGSPFDFAQGQNDNCFEIRAWRVCPTLRDETAKDGGARAFCKVTTDPFGMTTRKTCNSKGKSKMRGSLNCVQDEAGNCIGREDAFFGWRWEGGWGFMNGPMFAKRKTPR